MNAISYKDNGEVKVRMNMRNDGKGVDEDGKDRRTDPDTILRCCV